MDKDILPSAFYVGFTSAEDRDRAIARHSSSLVRSSPGFSKELVGLSAGGTRVGRWRACAARRSAAAQAPARGSRLNHRSHSITTGAAHKALHVSMKYMMMASFRKVALLQVTHCYRSRCLWACWGRALRQGVDRTQLNPSGLRAGHARGDTLARGPAQGAACGRFGGAGQHGPLCAGLQRAGARALTLGHADGVGHVTDCAVQQCAAPQREEAFDPWGLLSHSMLPASPLLAAVDWGSGSPSSSSKMAVTAKQAVLAAVPKVS